MTQNEHTPLLKVTVVDGKIDVEQSSETPKKVEKNPYEDVTPSWNEVMHKIRPFLLPADRKHSIYAFLALLSIITGKVLSVLPPIAFKHAIDIISLNATDAEEGEVSAKPIFEALGVYAILQTLIMVNGVAQDLAQRTVALDAERRFGNTVFSHLHHLSLSYHLEKHIGEITRVMNRGTDSMSTLISSFLFYVFPTFFEAIIISIVFWKVIGIPSIAFSTLGAIALYLFFTIFVTKTRIVFRRKLIEASDAVAQKETETLVNFETVTMFGRSQHEIELYKELRQIYKDRRVEMLAMFAILAFGQNFIKLFGSCGGLVIAAWASVYGLSSGEYTVSPGTFVIVHMYIDQLFVPLTQLGWQYRMITQAFTDLEKTVSTLYRVPEVRDVDDAIVWKPIDQKDCVVEFKNVSFHYKVKSKKRALGTALNIQTKGMTGGKHGLRRGRAAMGFVDEGVDPSHNDDEENEHVKLGGVNEISLRVPEGNTLALVGPSGSGKTTIVRLLLRLYDVDEGSVIVGDSNVKGFTQQSLRENIGIVAQDTVLFNATLRENIIYGKEDASEEEVWNAVQTAALDKFVLGLPNGLDTIVGERGMKLSGGERQRVGMARCLIKNPKIMILDEATSALDNATEREIQDNIATICKSRTTIMIAHRLSTIRKADEIVFLDNGRIVEKGSHEALMLKNGHYAKMWKAALETDEDEPSPEE